MCLSEGFVPLCVLQTNMGGGAEAQSGDFRGPWTVPEGSRLQRWICWTERARHCSDPVFLQIQGWPAVEVRVWYQGRKATTSSYDYLPLNKWDFVRTQLWWHCKKDLFFLWFLFLWQLSCPHITRIVLLICPFHPFWIWMHGSLKGPLYVT